MNGASPFFTDSNLILYWLDGRDLAKRNAAHEWMSLL